MAGAPWRSELEESMADWAADEREATTGQIFEQQLRSWEREKLACRLKLCCSLQLVKRI